MRRTTLLTLAAISGLGALTLGCSKDTAATTPAAGSSTSAAPSPRSVAGSTAAPITTGTRVEQPKLTSSAFAEGAEIPVKHACTAQGGANASPPLAWTGFPTDAATLVLVVHDPDAPMPGGFTHQVTQIPPDRTSLADDAGAADGPMAAWIGPCPPSGTHRYEFTLYAFGSDDLTLLPPNPTKKDIDAIASRARASAKLTGLFTRK